MARLAPVLLLATLAIAACVGNTTVPGQALGQFDFTAWEIAGDCQDLLERPRPRADGSAFDFGGIFSMAPDGGVGWFTLNDASRRGTFDGQRFESILPEPGSDAGTVPRTFEVREDLGCGSQFLVTETLRVVFLSPSQAEALGEGRCPPDPEPLLGDGGVPVDPDAGIVPPELVPQFNARDACGTLTDLIVPARECAAFQGCTLVYRVVGTRAQ